MLPLSQDSDVEITVVWCFFSNCADAHELSFAVRAMHGHTYVIVGATIPT